MQRVLIVDDDLGVLALMRRHIERAFQCQVEAVSSFHEAIEALQVGVFDALITDFALDNCHTGVALLGDGSFGNSDCQAILITGLDDPSIEEQARRVGFVSCVVKDQRFLERLTAAVDVLGVLQYRSRT